MYDYYYDLGIGMIFILVVFLLIPAIFFLLTLQNTLKAISPENRRMEPGNVWLMLIPFFNIVWQFIMVDRIAQSIAAECAMLNIPSTENKPTYGIGLAWNICNCITIIPFLGGLASLITFIIYWAKVSEYKNRIKANQGGFILDAERESLHAGKPQ